MSRSSSAKLNGYQSIDRLIPIYIRLEGVNLGSYHASNHAVLKACIGSRKYFLPNAYEFHITDPVQHTWTCNFSNPDRSSFIIALFKRRLFGNDHEVGEIEIKVNAFEPNTVTTKEFELLSPNRFSTPARVRVSVHIAADGSSPFQAPLSTNIKDNFEIPHNKTYLPQ